VSDYRLIYFFESAATLAGRCYCVCAGFCSTGVADVRGVGLITQKHCRCGFRQQTSGSIACCAVCDGFV
jgi:hypothetical protein